MRSTRQTEACESVNLLNESPNTKVILTRKRVKGKIKERYYIARKGEPQFSLEANAGDKSDFIWQSKSNKLLGVIKDGELKKPKSLEKIFYFSKLDLKPSENFILEQDESDSDYPTLHNHHSQQDHHTTLLLSDRLV